MKHAQFWNKRNVINYYIVRDANSNVCLASLFIDLDSLRLQESEKQNTYKLSYYAAPTINAEALLYEIQVRLEQNAIAASLIWSIDETTNTGLLDILPKAATKRHAVEFLINQQG